ncbi:hypothetical protein Q1695_000389 [Nippostrongylus brasiliensis]|nr:hypothetical protein Q1695_000389 [Nippostrongylus brasiliensis]
MDPNAAVFSVPVLASLLTTVDTFGYEGYSEAIFTATRQECKYTAASCQYGFFGCVKIATYSGGVDKMGMFYDQDRHITLMVRGCAILPFGGVDRCEQTSFLGYRIQKCTCFNDYCNSSYRLTQFTLIHILIVIVAWSA